MHDRKTTDFLKRIRKDISQLKGDVSTLFSHTTQNTVPSGAKELADYGRDRLSAGSDYAAAQLRYLRAHPGQSSAGILGGLILLGAVGAGIYYLCKSDCCGKRACCEEEEDELYPEKGTELPPYIS